MADSDNYPKRFPTSQKGEKIDHGADALAEMNKNKHVLDPGKAPHINWDDGKREDYRTAERKREKHTVL